MYYTKRHVQRSIDDINQILKTKYKTDKIFLSCKDDNIERDCLTLHIGKEILRFTQFAHSSDKFYAMELLYSVLAVLKLTELKVMNLGEIKK